MLLTWAGVEWGDVEAMVTKDGVESTLDSLCRAGVYVTIEEFKGKRPIRRTDRPGTGHAARGLRQPVADDPL